VALIRTDVSDGSAVARRSVHQEHRVRFSGASMLSTRTGCMDRIVREATEVELHPHNVNGEEGFCLGKSWRPLICTLRWAASHTSWVLLNTLQYLVPLHEASSPPPDLAASIMAAPTHCHYYTQNTVILHPQPYSSNLDYLRLPRLAQSTTSLCL
jgi:hypothetical protein